MLKEIKVGRAVHEIKKGDFIFWNKKVYQFFAGDNRGLIYLKYECHSSIILTAAAVKRIDLKSMQKVVSKDGCIKYYF